MAVPGRLRPACSLMPSGAGCPVVDLFEIRRPSERIRVRVRAARGAIVGTGLIGTSIAMAAARAGCTVRGWDIDPDVAARAAARSGLTACTTPNEAVTGADLVIISTPIGAVARSVSAALRAAPD